MKKSLRIAVDARPLAFPMVGITRYTYELISRLAHNSSHRWYLYSDKPLIHRLSSLPNLHVRTGKQSAAIPSTFFAQRHYPRWVQEDEIDVFWSPRHHLPVLMSQKIKKLLTIHDLVWKKYPETMTRSGRLLEKLLMPISISQADKVIAVSDSTSQDILEAFPQSRDKLQMVYSGLTHVDCSLLKPVDSGKPYFLFVGTLEPRKNLKRLLGAFALIKEKNDEVRLVVIGAKGWGNESIYLKIKELRLEHDVTLLGRTGEMVLAQYYQNAVALVMPSLYEGFGLPLLEAMGYGVPVITSNRGALAEISGDGGILIDPLSESDIAKAMIQMLEAEVRLKISERALIRSTQFDWGRSAEQVLRIIEEL